MGCMLDTLSCAPCSLPGVHPHIRSAKIDLDCPFEAAAHLGPWARKILAPFAIRSGLLSLAWLCSNYPFRLHATTQLLKDNVE